MSSYNIAKRCSGCFKETKCGGGSGKIGNAEGIYEYVIKYKEDFLKLKIMRTSL
jgi:hypothetical protein